MTRERQLLASFIAEFRKAKKSGDPMDYARKCKALAQLYGSSMSLAEKLGIGKETVRVLARVADLPPYVQSQISRRKIPLTVGFDLVPLDRDKQIEAAKAISGLSFKEARKVIRRLSENRNTSADTIRAEVLNALEKRELNLAIIAIPRNMYDLLRKESEDVAQLISAVVERWLVNDGPLERNYDATRNSVPVTVRFSRKTFAALRRRTRKPANLVERVLVTWLKQKGKTR